MRQTDLQPPGVRQPGPRRAELTPRDWLHRNSTPFLLGAGMLLVAGVTWLIGESLVERIVTVMFIDVILVLALQVFMGNSGILSFSVAGFMGIGAYGSVLFSMTPAAKAAALPDLYAFLAPVHLPFVVSLLLGGLIAALVAAVVSYPLMRLSDAAGVITIFSLLIIINVVLVHWSVVTNGPRTLFGVDRYTYLGTTVGFAVAFLGVAWWFKESRVGLRLRASRDDAHAASSIGINIVAMRYAAFVLSAFMAGFAGALWAHFITSFSPYAFYLSAMFVFLAMLVIGGPNGVSGAVVGTVLVTVLREGLRSIENNVNMAHLLPAGLFGFTEIVLAALLIVILILRPGGIMGGTEIRWPPAGGKPGSTGGPGGTGESPRV
ncbi:MAG TPA: branched-chain amino acid ABC transporter permease [Spirochaetia bacterium]|nr:branched-chain amino acid ABC transporter permease [Spirochaetia bacterium]